MLIDSFVTPPQGGRDLLYDYHAGLRLSAHQSPSLWGRVGGVKPSGADADGEGCNAGTAASPCSDAPAWEQETVSVGMHSHAGAWERENRDWRRSRLQPLTAITGKQPTRGKNRLLLIDSCPTDLQGIFITLTLALSPQGRGDFVSSTPSDHPAYPGQIRLQAQAAR